MKYLSEIRHQKQRLSLFNWVLHIIPLNNYHVSASACVDHQGVTWNRFKESVWVSQWTDWIGYVTWFIFEYVLYHLSIQIPQKGQRKIVPGLNWILCIFNPLEMIRTVVGDNWIILEHVQIVRPLTASPQNLKKIMPHLDLDPSQSIACSPCTSFPIIWLVYAEGLSLSHNFYIFFCIFPALDLSFYLWWDALLEIEGGQELI